LLSGGYKLRRRTIGHIILFDINTTGDGLASALDCWQKIIKETDLNLGELTRDFVNYRKY
jgi:hypothetical protein